MVSHFQFWFLVLFFSFFLFPFFLLKALWWFVGLCLLVLWCFEICMYWVWMPLSLHLMRNTKMFLNCASSLHHSLRHFGCVVTCTVIYFIMIYSLFHSLNVYHFCSRFCFILKSTFILFLFLKLIFSTSFFFYCMSALQSPLRVYGDNIYVRHSNLMLEVGTGIVWWPKIRTTCFCVLWRHQNYNFLCTVLYKTAALSHSQALCACLRVFMRV